MSTTGLTCFQYVYHEYAMGSTASFLGCVLSYEKQVWHSFMGCEELKAGSCESLVSLTQLLPHLYGEKRSRRKRVELLCRVSHRLLRMYHEYVMAPHGKYVSCAASLLGCASYGIFSIEDAFLYSVWLPSKELSTVNNVCGCFPASLSLMQFWVPNFLPN